MINKPRRNVLAQTDSGMMIVSRFDFCESFAGIGQQILNSGCTRTEELSLLFTMLDPIKDSPVVLEVGANIGSLTVGMCEFIAPHNGTIHCFEPQRLVFQMLNGNLALNNIDNAYTYQVGVGKADRDYLIMPNVDYYSPASYGSVELHGNQQLENFGQQMTYNSSSERVPFMTVDFFVNQQSLPKVDMLKVDVEGMEFDVLEGAKDTILKYKPVIYIEWWKVNMDDLGNTLQDMGYLVRVHQGNFIAIPTEKQHLYQSLLGTSAS